MGYKGDLQRWAAKRLTEVGCKRVYRGGLQRGLQRWIAKVFTEVGCKGVYRGELQRGFTKVGYRGM